MILPTTWLEYWWIDTFLYLKIFLFKFEDTCSHIWATLELHVLFLSTLFWLLLYILDEKFVICGVTCPANHEASHHNTCLSCALPCITFCSGSICYMSLNICLGDMHDMWPVHMLLLEVFIWWTLTCKFGEASVTDKVRRFSVHL